MTPAQKKVAKDLGNGAIFSNWHINKRTKKILTALTEAGYAGYHGGSWFRVRKTPLAQLTDLERDTLDRLVKVKKLDWLKTKGIENGTLSRLIKKGFVEHKDGSYVPTQKAKDCFETKMRKS